MLLFFRSPLRTIRKHCKENCVKKSGFRLGFICALFAAAFCVSCAPYQKRLAAEFDVDGRIVFLKARYGMWKMVGRNYSTEHNLSVIIEPLRSKAEYQIFCRSAGEVFVTESRMFFFGRLLDLAEETGVSWVYALQPCSRYGTFDFLDYELKESGIFSDIEYEECEKNQAGGESVRHAIKASRKSDGAQLVFVIETFCTCGSDGWIEFREEENPAHWLKMIFGKFYY